MRVKKKDLRKRLPQLPINYPGPVIEVPFHYERESTRVENLCRRLADNEVETRDAVLRELPRYILEVCSRTEFAEICKQRSMPQDFSYAEWSEFLSSTSKSNSHNNNNNQATTTKKSGGGQSSIFYSDAVRDLALLFDKLNLGIFFAFWHSDKPLVQHECAHRIALLCHVPPTHFLKLLFWRSMWRAVAAKWSIIDQYRMDKYMAYVRKLVFQSLRDICEITVAEARPVGWYSSSSSSSSEKNSTNNRSGDGSGTTTLLSADAILQDAMRLVGNDYNLAKYNSAQLRFKDKFAKHLALKRQRREEHEAAMAAKLSKNTKKNKKIKKAKKEEESNAAAARGAQDDDSDDGDDDSSTAAAAGKKKKKNRGGGGGGGDDAAKRVPKKTAAAATSSSNNNNNLENASTPASAVFLVAFTEMIRTEVFRCNTSVGLSMHIIDVIVDELRRCTPTHSFPSFIVAVLFSLPIAAMANTDVVQIERRVQLMLVQPIAGGVFEKIFVSAATAERLRKKQENDDAAEEFDDDDDAGNKKKEATSEEVALGIAKSVALADATASVLKQTGLDPRTKFLMRPLLEDASRTVAGYVLHRRRPMEYSVVTGADKRRMLNAAVKKQMFENAEKTGDGGVGGTGAPVATDAKTAKLLRKKKLLLLERKKMKAAAAGAGKKKTDDGSSGEKKDKKKLVHHRRQNKKLSKKKGSKR